MGGGQGDELTRKNGVRCIHIIGMGVILNSHGRIRSDAFI